MTEELETLPENDAPPLPEGMTPEMRVLLNVVYEKRDDMNTMLGVLNMTNQVEEGELPPYDIEQLADAEVLFKHAFKLLAEAIGGSYAQD